jgi:glyoxylase-like metal-dependent hydrolase (beta-lactamase superfamily II)
VRAQESLFEMKPVAEGVYAAIARPQYKVNSNAVIVINDDGVLVIDSHSKPSSARALIAEVRKLTDKPVRYVVNTHFHFDHTQGNQAYPTAFPKEVTIISSETTRQLLSSQGIPSVRQQLEQMPAEITALQERLASEKDVAVKAKLEDDLRQAREYMGELRQMEIRLPDLTFDKSLILHKKNRDIFILFLGRGHTAGDTVVYLPRERVVATGDLLHAFMPTLRDAYPQEWIETLDQVSKLDFDTLIGGHGDVRPKSHLTFFRNYLADLIEQTRASLKRGETLEQAKKSVAAALAPRYESGMAGRFAGSVGANIEKVYADLQGGKY